MLSLYAQYLIERTDDRILEIEEGFITWRQISPETFYIIDIYIKPQFRECGIASNLADQVCRFAKAAGAKEVIGTVVPSLKGATESIQTLVAYGMRVSSSTENLIVFKKEL